MGLEGIRTLSLGGNGGSGPGGIAKYPDFASLPGTATNGDVAITLDTDTIYVYNGVAWVPVSGVTSPLDIADTPSIDLTLQSPGVSNILSADLLISPVGATTGFLKIDSTIDAGSSPGLIGQFQAYPVYESTSSVLQVFGITTQVPGSTLSFQVNQSSGLTSGYLSFTDWNTFNNKQDTVQIGPLSAASFANGATIFGPTFQLGPADGTNPGVVTTIGQTFAGDKTFLGVIAGQNGTLSNVAFHLGTDVGTGFFRAAVNQLNLAAAGATIMVWGTNNVSTTVPILGAPGSTIAPEFSFAADSDTGMYNPTANNLQFVIGSTASINLQPGVMRVFSDQIQSPDGTNVAPVYSFASAPGAGVYMFGASQLGIAVGSTTPGYFDLQGYRTWQNKNIRWRDSGSLDLTVVAPTGFSNAMTWVLPLDQGLTNTVMTNDGLGNLSWTTPSSGFGATNALVLYGASSGVWTASVGNSFASFSNVLPLAQGATGSVLVNDGAGNLSWSTNVSSNYAISSSCGGFNLPSGGYTDVTNLSVTLTTTGNPVILQLVSDGSGNEAYFDIQNNNAGSQAAIMDVNFVEGSTVIARQEWGYSTSGMTVAAMNLEGLPTAHRHWYVPAAGTYTYKVQVRVAAGTNAQVANVKLLAYEQLTTPIVLPTTLAVTARASTDAGQTINSSPAIVDFEDVTYDSGGNITTGASWKYTCGAGEDGVYHVSVQIVCNQASGGGTGTGEALLKKNGASYSRIGFWSANDTDPFIWIEGEDSITLAAGDYIHIEAVSSAFTVTMVAGGGTYNYITIQKVG